MTTFRNSFPLKAYYFGLIGLLYLPKLIPSQGLLLRLDRLALFTYRNPLFIFH